MASKLYSYALKFYYGREVSVPRNMQGRLEILREIVLGYKSSYGKLSSKRLRHIVNYFVDNYVKIKELYSNGSCKLCCYAGDYLFYHISKHIFDV